MTTDLPFILRLGTYSTLDNHPKLLDSRKPRFDPVTGQPIIPARRKGKGRNFETTSTIAESEEDEDEEEFKPKVTIARKKGESAEEKKARKSAVKEERAVRFFLSFVLVPCYTLAGSACPDDASFRQARRVQKKSTQTLFATERTKFINQQKGKVADGRGADLNIGTGRANVNVMRLV